MFQYIGELCRYLVDQPPHPRERAHRLRLAAATACGRDVWDAFQEALRHAADSRILRAPPKATCRSTTVEGKPGAIGRVPPFLAQRFPRGAGPLRRRDRHAAARRRTASASPAARRDRRSDRQDARCRATPAQQLRGLYRQRPRREKKFLRNVFAPGDAWFRTGDLMRKDASGYFYFRRSHRRHVPLEGRKCLDHRSRGSDPRLPGIDRCRGLRRRSAGPGRPRRHGDDRRRRRLRS